MFLRLCKIYPCVIVCVALFAFAVIGGDGEPVAASSAEAVEAVEAAPDTVAASGGDVAEAAEAVSEDTVSLPVMTTTVPSVPDEPERPAEVAARPEAVKPASRTIVVPSPEAKNIGAAMAAARPGDTVRVKEGTYRETIFITPGVVLISNTLFKATLDGRGKGRGSAIVTMGTGSVISGFEIRNGTIGVFSAVASAAILRCRISHNAQSGIMAVGVLPRIEDNIIVHNKGSGIQGWDVRTTSGSINHNTIAYNANHGISLGGNTSVTVENNIISFNDQFGVKPGAESVRVALVNNNFYQNARISNNLPSDNMSADPMFVDAKRFNFNMQKESRCIGQGTDNQNLGARILH